jgi:phospholipid/cholesterol/gamma-HCH transport system substrate-binding protein
MENKSHSFAAGLFVLTLGVLGILGALWLQGPKKPLRVPVNLTTTHSVEGLRLNALVRYRGIDVGSVESISFDKYAMGHIRVRIEIDPSTPLTRSSYAKLSFQGINGVPIIQLDDNQQGDHDPLQLTHDQIPELELQAGLLEVAEKSAQDVLAKAGAVATRLELLLDDRNTQRLMSLVDSARQTSARFDLLASELEPTAKLLPNLLQQTTLAVSQARVAGERLALLSSDADRRLGFLDSVAAAADDLQRQTLPRVNDLVDHLSANSHELEDTLHLINIRPQSLIFGLATSPPGPGEPGFKATTDRRP